MSRSTPNLVRLNRSFMGTHFVSSEEYGRIIGLFSWVEYGVFNMISSKLGIPSWCFPVQFWTTTYTLKCDFIIFQRFCGLPHLGLLYIEALCMISGFNPSDDITDSKGIIRRLSTVSKTSTLQRIQIRIILVLILDDVGRRDSIHWPRIVISVKMCHYVMTQRITTRIERCGYIHVFKMNP